MNDEEKRNIWLCTPPSPCVCRLAQLVWCAEGTRKKDRLYENNNKNKKDHNKCKNKSAKIIDKSKFLRPLGIRITWRKSFKRRLKKKKKFHRVKRYFARAARSDEHKAQLFLGLAAFRKKIYNNNKCIRKFIMHFIHVIMEYAQTQCIVYYIRSLFLKRHCIYD